MCWYCSSHSSHCSISCFKHSILSLIYTIWSFPWHHRTCLEPALSTQYYHSYIPFSSFGGIIAHISNKFPPPSPHTQTPTHNWNCVLRAGLILQVSVLVECAGCEGRESGICDLDHSSTYPHSSHIFMCPYTFSSDPTAAPQIQFRILNHSHLNDHRSCRQCRIYVTGGMHEGDAKK